MKLIRAISNAKITNLLARRQNVDGPALVQQRGAPALEQRVAAAIECSIVGLFGQFLGAVGFMLCSCTGTPYPYFVSLSDTIYFTYFPLHGLDRVPSVT